MQKKVKWEWELRPDPPPFYKSIPELFRFKDLLKALIKKELTAGYQQTIIGYAWLFFQPLLTTLFYFIVFGRIIKVNTAGIPPLLFYMSATILWSYFADCLISIMYTFVHQSHIFRKIYFPRLIVPIAMIANHSIRYGIQFLLFIVVYFGWVMVYGGLTITWSILLLPLIFLQVILLSMGSGFIISVYMSKYRDLEFLVQFLVRLFMFVTPVLYPASMVPNAYKIWYWLNPLTAVFEIYRAIFFTHQTINLIEVLPSIFIAISIFIYGLVLFHRKEKLVLDVI